MNDLRPTGLVPIRHETAPLRSRIIEAMRAAIESGALRPGERLVEKDLCRQLDVSRTSLREALRKLEAEGVIAQTGARGLTVVKISRRDAENIYAVRADIEALVVAQFCEAADAAAMAELDHICEELVAAYHRGEFAPIIEVKRRMHAHLCAVADNAVALDLLLRLTLRTAQLRSRSVTRPERQKQSILEIENLRRAIDSRDSEAARAAARRHVHNAAVSALILAGQ